MKLVQYKYLLVNENVWGGVTSGNFPVIYAVPDFLEREDAERLISIVENKPELLKVVTNYNLKSNSPEWENFWKIFSENEEGQKILEKYSGEIQNLKNFRISRAKPGADTENLKLYDQWARENLGKTALPSFQDWWTLSASKGIDKGAKSLEDVVKSPAKDYGYQHKAHSGTLLGQRPVTSL